MSENGTVAHLVGRATEGDADAWHAIVERFAPLVWAICRHHGLNGADAQDVNGAVWLHLVEHLATLRDPAALPGWIATTTRHECLRLVSGKGARQRRELVGEDHTLASQNSNDDDMLEALLEAAERHAALREAFAELPPQHKELLVLLIHDPPMTYRQISEKLAMPVGSIGPTRARCLERIRGHPAIAALIDDGSGARPGTLGKGVGP